MRTDIDHPNYFVPGHRTCAGPNSPCRPSSDSASAHVRPVLEQEEEGELQRPNRGNGKRPRPMQPLRRIDRVRRLQLRRGLLLLRSDTWRDEKKAVFIRFLPAPEQQREKEKDQRAC